MFKLTYDILEDLEARKCNVASQFCSNSVTNIFENSGTDDLSVCLQDNWTYLSQVPETMLSRMPLITSRRVQLQGFDDSISK